MRPISAVMIPTNNERHTATSGPVISGCASVTFDTAWPTNNETTAILYKLVSSYFERKIIFLLIGPMLISFDVPKKQYKVTPTNDVL